MTRYVFWQTGSRFKAGNRRSDFGRADRCHDVARKFPHGRTLVETAVVTAVDLLGHSTYPLLSHAVRLNSLAPSNVNSSTVNYGLMCRNDLPCRSKVAGKSWVESTFERRQAASRVMCIVTFNYIEWRVDSTIDSTVSSTKVASSVFRLSCVGARPRSNWNAPAHAELLSRSWNFLILIVNILIMHITKGF
jgi:hypothetical protein